MAFQKGKSGNPGGRPKSIKSLEKAARTHTVDALETLSSIMQNINEAAKDRIKAAELLLDRAWGKPVQMSPEYTPAQIAAMSDEELERLLKKG